MTLAAAFVINQVPVVMADMLVSLRSGPQQPGLQLPSSGPISNLPKNRPTLHGLRQKVAVIADNLAVAFAGDVASSMIVLSGLRRQAEKGPITAAVLEEFARGNAKRLSKTALVGFLVNRKDDGTFIASRVQWRGQSVEMGPLGSVDAAGTGGAVLQTFAEMLERPPPEPSAPSIRGALTTALSLCGMLLREEHATGSTIAVAASGGSYELAYFDGRKFVKTLDTTFVVWDAEVVDRTVDIKLPYLVLRQFYVDDNVVLNVARAQCGPSGEDFKYVSHTHVVPASHRAMTTLRRVESESLGFNSTTTVHSILITSAERVRVKTILEIGKSLFQAGETPDGTFVHRCDSSLLNAIRDVALSG